MFRRFPLWWMLCCLWLSPAAAQPVVLVLGDSLSAAYGVPLDRGWVSLLADRIETEGLPHRVVNASVSGETTAGGLARLPQLLARHEPTWVLIELGGNDGLRGQPIRQLRANLTAMIDQIHAAGARAVLFEMRIPSNYGPVYTEQFTRVFAEVAAEANVALVPFMLAAIAEDPARYFLDDGIHPNVDAQPLLLDAVWPVLAPLLQAAADSASTAGRSSRFMTSPSAGDSGA